MLTIYAPDPLNFPAALLPSTCATERPATCLRRRPTPAQGRALEILGHVIEYLVDSRLYLVDEPQTPADAEATHILMLASRAVFEECLPVPSTSQRLRRWLGLSSQASPSCPSGTAPDQKAA